MSQRLSDNLLLTPRVARQDRMATQQAYLDLHHTKEEESMVLTLVLCVCA